MSRVALLPDHAAGKCVDDDRVLALAAWRLEDVIRDRSVSSYPAEKAARELHISACWADKQKKTALKVLVLLTLFELPSWCDPGSDFFRYLPGNERCIVPKGEALLSTLPYIPPGYGIIVEVMCVLFIARKYIYDLLLQKRYFEPLGVEYSSVRVCYFGLAMAVLELADCAVFIALRPNFRIAFLARSGFLMMLPEVVNLSSCIYVVIVEFASAGVFYASTIALFSWVVATIFDDVKGEIFGDPINKGFESFSASFYTMFVCGATDDFVQYFIATYTSFRQTGLLWLCYLVIVYLLLLNLMLDTLVGAYQKYEEKLAEETVHEKTHGILHVFNELTLRGAGQRVSRDDFIAFIREFSRSPAVRPLTPEAAAVVFEACEPQSDALGRKGFTSACGVIEYEFWITKMDSPLSRCPCLWNSACFQKFRDFVHEGRFAVFMNYVLLVNLVLILIESSYDFEHKQEPAIMEHLELIFSIAYAVEVMLNLCVYSWGEYWSQRSNQFDFITTVLLLLSSVADELAISAAGAGKRYMNVLRMLRLLRVIKQLKRLKTVQNMADTVSNLIIASKEIMMFLFVVMFFFSTLGVQLWGGILYEENENLKGTNYADSNLYVLNFNDFALAFGVWFTSLLSVYVAEMPEAVSACSAVPSTWYIFLLYYLVGFCLAFQLAEAFTIETFLELREKWDEEEEENEGLVAVTERFREEGFGLNYRTGGDPVVHEAVEEALAKLHGEHQEKEAKKKESLAKRSKPMQSVVRGLQREHGIALAAWQLEDAIAGRAPAAYPTFEGARELHFASARAGKVFGWALFGMVVLTYLETPSWCDTSSNLFFWSDANRCSISGVHQAEILLSGLPQLPPGLGVLIEALLVMAIGRKFLADWRLQKRGFEPIGVSYVSLRVSAVGLALVGLELVDMVLFMAFQPGFRLAFLSRAGYLCLLPSSRRLGSCISAVIGEFTSIAIFFLGTIVLIAWVVAMMFDGVEGEIFGDPINKGIDSFGSALYTLFTTGVANNFAQYFVPSYTAFRASGLLWMFFLVAVELLLLNLVLDTLVGAYQRYQDDIDESVTDLKLQGIFNAFMMLRDATGQKSDISEENFRDFVAEFSRSPAMRPITDEEAGIIFRAVDADGSGKVDKREFFDLCGVVAYEFWAVRRHSCLEAIDCFWNSRRFSSFRAYVDSGRFNVFMNYVLLVNLLLICVESYYDLEGKDEPALMEHLELIFSFIYLFEVLGNLAVMSWGEYWSSFSNKFDFSTTMLLLISSLYSEMVISSAGQDVKRTMNILRMLRLLRVLKQLKRLKTVQSMVATVVALVKASRDIVTLLGVVVFFYSQLGVQLWGGLLYESNPDLEDGAAYRDNHLYALNFNDVASASGVWIVMLLCEFVADYPDAIAMVSSIPVSWFLFVTFYVVGVAIVFELVKAFTIDAFLDLRSRWGEEEKELRSLAAIREEFEKNGKCLHYRVIGDQSTHESVIAALNDLDDSLLEEDAVDRPSAQGHHHNRGLARLCACRSRGHTADLESAPL